MQSRDLNLLDELRKRLKPGWGAWNKMPESVVWDAARLKLWRLRFAPNPEKALDELCDMINYALKFAERKFGLRLLPTPETQPKPKPVTVFAHFKADEGALRISSEGVITSASGPFLPMRPSPRKMYKYQIVHPVCCPRCGPLTDGSRIRYVTRKRKKYALCWNCYSVLMPC